MSSTRENDEMMMKHVVDMLHKTRGWMPVITNNNGTVMQIPGGSTRLIVTRVWSTLQGGGSELAENAARFAATHSREEGGFVLAIMSLLGPAERMHMAGHIKDSDEVLDERELLEMARRTGPEAIERYKMIAGNAGIRRSILQI